MIAIYLSKHQLLIQIEKNQNHSPNILSIYILFNLCVFAQKTRGRNKRGCNYFEWHDNSFHPQANKVIKELHSEVSNLKIENEQLKFTYYDRSINGEFHKLEVECEELRRKMKAISDENGKNKCQVWFLGATLIFNWALILCILCCL